MTDIETREAEARRTIATAVENLQDMDGEIEELQRSIAEIETEIDELRAEQEPWREQIRQAEATLAEVEEYRSQQLELPF